MARKRTGSLVARHGAKYIRVQYTDAQGRRRDRMRKVQDPKKWRSEREQFLLELEQEQAETGVSASMLFSDLADFFEREYVKPPMYVDGQKVSGYRSYKTVLGYLKPIRAHFDSMELHRINYEDLRAFRNSRLATSTIRNRPRTIASVNRELSFLRRMFRIAERKKWLVKSPFRDGDALYSFRRKSRESAW